MTYGAKNPLTGMGDGYVKLWAAVMEQAVEDLTLNGFNRNTIRIRHEGRIDVYMDDLKAARAFGVKAVRAVLMVG